MSPVRVAAAKHRELHALHRRLQRVPPRLYGKNAVECINHDADDAQERIHESALSVQVRSGWFNPGQEQPPIEEFEILLCTGGPAVRIVGDLDNNGQPDSPRIEHQDWETPWTVWAPAFDPGPHIMGDINRFSETLLAFCNQFYLGDG